MIRYRRDLWRLLETPGAVAEIGVAEGRFSLEILGWPNVTCLYLVDRWKCAPEQKGDASMPETWHEMNYAGMKERIRTQRDRVKVLRGHSVEMATLVEDESLAIVYIDGDHSYEGVRADIIAWAPKIRPGGYFAFHDYESPQYGVKRAVQEYATARGSEIFLLAEDNINDAGAYLIC